MEKLELPKFNLELPKGHIIVVDYPTEGEITSLIVSKQTQDAINQSFKEAKPLVVAAVGELDETSMVVKEGDMVFIKPDFKHTAVMLPFDNDRRWLNPIIIPAYGIAAKVVYTETYENKYAEIVEKVEANIKLKKARLAKS
jgi:hypothetical protein